MNELSIAVKYSSIISKKTRFSPHWQAYFNAVAQLPYYDEAIDNRSNTRSTFHPLFECLTQRDIKELGMLQKQANGLIEALGISFLVYRDTNVRERSWPLDIIPRVISDTEWRRVEDGLRQRLHAINLFLQDIYTEERILKDGIVPAELVKKSPFYRPQCVGVKPRFGVWAHVCGSDLVRDETGAFYVLEDNLRVPSGVSYMLENREVMQRVAPDWFEKCPVRGVVDYVRHLYEMLASLSPRQGTEPSIVVWTPGQFNSAYFEHAYLARRMGVPLAEGRDMVVVDDVVYLRTIYGLSRVDVVYRRLDDGFIDPTEMDADSLLGVSGLMNAWRLGNVAIANAPGTGVADDKVIYAYFPAIIDYYLKEEPILRNIPTLDMGDKNMRAHVFDNPRDFVVKPANASGGYGIVIGAKASSKTLKTLKQKVTNAPRNYVAQPLIALSTAPVLSKGRIVRRHIDLRPFSLQGDKLFITAGGLTRVAARTNSFIVNSSQGGGGKDTWILKT